MADDARQKDAEAYRRGEGGETHQVAGDGRPTLTTRQGTPVVIVNRGPTRGDGLATLKADAGCSPLLRALSANYAD